MAGVKELVSSWRFGGGRRETLVSFLVWLWFRSPHYEHAATTVRPSEPPHHGDYSLDPDRRPSAVEKLVKPASSKRYASDRLANWRACEGAKGAGTPLPIDLFQFVSMANISIVTIAQMSAVVCLGTVQSGNDQTPHERRIRCRSWHEPCENAGRRHKRTTVDGTTDQCHR